MKVTQEKLPASQVGLEIEITPEMSKQAYERVLQDFTRSTNIPGFRKGKVPRQVLIQRFGPTRIKAAAVEDLVDKALKAALEQEKIEAIGNFQLRSSFEELVTQFEPGNSLTFSAAVDIQPEVDLKQYTGLSVQAEEVKPEEGKVDTVLGNYQTQMATLVPVEGRAAQKGDTAVVDYHGRFTPAGEDAEEQDVPGGQAQDFQIELDDGKFIPGFIDGIVEMNPGDTKEVSVTFPDDYPQEELAGRPATFTMTLKELKEKELPELDDDFAQDASGGDYPTIAELRESLEKRFAEEAEQKTKSNKEQAILDELITQVEVELPETLVEREVEFMITQTAMQLQNQGIDIKRLLNQETLPMLKERSRPDAIDRIKRTLALGEVAKRESLTTSESEVNAKVREVMADLEGREVDADRLRSAVAEDLLKEKILAWLEEHNTIDLVPEGTLKKEEEVLEDDAIELDADDAIELDADDAIEVEASTIEAE
ncbi:trigger factor [Phormidesmis priestleyi ULC007]|uniref:Trigger factor n=1 Tax=Phormidesmis priestleyi ULC007 TaxID=1920490 RepID=A0A2T1D3D7_9CYAN|nr:trigger factor [Phormidesmis priestleyi]PSB14977.1 trigger factor [Phormidesmis priestleyi ULC007]PZO46370.1 MAG: trigger factor [Phormidesmis priestleyi]